MTCGTALSRSMRTPPLRLVALTRLAVFAGLCIGTSHLQAQAPVGPATRPAPPRASVPSASRPEMPAAGGMTPVAGEATIGAAVPASDPALVYVPATSEAVLSVDLSKFGDDENLYPLYRVLLQGVMAGAPVPPERLEDLERLTLFVVPYDASASEGAVDLVTTPSAYLAQAQLDATTYGFGFVLRFAEPFFDRDLRKALGPDAERVPTALIPTYRVGGTVIRLLENRYVVAMQADLPATIVPYLDPDAFARTPEGERFRALREGASLRARAVVGGNLVRQFAAQYLSSDDSYLFQTFWNDRVEAWTLQFDAATAGDFTSYVVRAMIVTDGEATAATLEEDLVAVVRLALAAARDYQATFQASSAGGARGTAVDPAALLAASFLEAMVSEGRLRVGHVASAAGLQLFFTPEEFAELPSMLGRLAGAATSDADALAKDRARQRRVVQALLAYRDATGTYPSSVINDAESGEPRSWRVELLPYLDEEELYERYRKDEPWDSPANQALIAEIPDVYRSSFDKANPPGLAVAALVHPEGLFSPEGPVARAQLVDSPASTMLTASVRLPISWTRPQDIDAAGTDDLSDLAWTNAGVLAGFADGRVHLLAGVSPQTLRSLVIRDDGKPFADIESVPGVQPDPGPEPQPETLTPPVEGPQAAPARPESPALPSVEDPFAVPEPSTKP